jgi:hypothetical protein
MPLEEQEEAEQRNAADGGGRSFLSFSCPWPAAADFWRCANEMTYEIEI